MFIHGLNEIYREKEYFGQFFCFVILLWHHKDPQNQPKTSKNHVTSKKHAFSHITWNIHVRKFIYGLNERYLRKEYFGEKKVFVYSIITS